MFMELWNQRIPLLILAPLRLCCGYLALTAGLGKVEAGWLTQPLLRERVETMLVAARGSRLASSALHNVAAHALWYGRLVALVEVIAGAALLVGLCSRYAALSLWLLALGFLLGGGRLVPDGALLLQGAALLTLALCSSGRALGLDGLLRPHLPLWLT